MAPSFTGPLSGNATTATTATNADKLDGYHGSAAQAVNTYVLRNSSGYTFHNYINSNTSNNENPSVSQVIVTNGSDHYYRKASLAHLKAQMGLNNVNNTADSAKSVNYATSAGSASSATNATQSYGVVASNTSVNGRVAMSVDLCFRTYNRAGSAALNGIVNLGSGSYRWKQLFAATTTISTSDRNLKDHIHTLSQKHLDFFMLLQPVSFTFKDGASGRTHIGFIAQDVEAAMKECGLTDLDFAGFCKDVKTTVYLTTKTDEDGNETEQEIEEPILDEDGNLQYIYSLRYEEFIALNTHMIQKLCDRVSALECEGDDLRSRIGALEQLMLQKS